ncbi:MAG: hypothetical protein NC934_06530 [Candidatus Omnitrophica bacterium]|nr:hypothetical protein [Candidatus Omnitrophota bacterium]
MRINKKGVMENLFGEIEQPKIYEVNIYADEIMNKKCSYTNELWNYIGIIIENCKKPILDEIIRERFMNNFDTSSPYYEKNNKVIHWKEMKSADEVNICKRWFNYILNNENFYFYLLGLNVSKLNIEEFDQENEFNSIYNRFFRAAVLYGVKTFFSDYEVIIQNIYHEQGQQQNHQYFPWHIIHKISQSEEKISFSCSEVTFLSKDHKIKKESNILQLVDALMGAITNIIHGVEQSKKSNNREPLLKIILNKVQIATSNTYTDEWVKKHFLIRFFPKKKTTIDDRWRYLNQFYNIRKLKYIEDISYGERTLFDQN